MATASDHSLPAINELLSARSEVYLFVYVLINASPVETPDDIFTSVSQAIIL